MSPINHRTTTIHRPERTSVAASGAVEIREILEDTYGVRLRLQQVREDDLNPVLTHERVDVGPIAIEKLRLPGEMAFAPDPLNRVVALWATGGRVEGHCDGIKGEAADGELTMVSQPDLPHSVRVEDLSVTALLLDPAVVAGVAAGVPTCQAPSSIRFEDFRPVDEAAARLWKSTVNYVQRSVLADDVTATPIVIGHAGRLLAAVTLSAFPARARREPSRFDCVDDKPALLRRAIDYMERNADQDIALADVADAIHVTPRAVQYMFRKHTESTPLQYLRQLRLHRAHKDLQKANRMDETVTAIAARWGFMHSGRFAVQYRQTYGQSPHETLRG